MKSAPLYQQIVAAIRQELLDGRLRLGDPLPPVREMAARWNCAPGTVQQAYKELAGQGIVVSRTGQGTRIGANLPTASGARDSAPLRRAGLVHQAETFLLEVLSAGYSPTEAESAFRAALDRWRTLENQPAAPGDAVLRFVGSHDPAISLLAAEFPGIFPGGRLDVTFSGSLGGLIALAEGKADIAGSHLWDAESDTYNEPFVRRLLPGRRAALVTLAYRRLGLLIAPGNPLGVRGLRDLAAPGVRFMNRQRGAGTRVWLDAQLHRLEIPPSNVRGYTHEATTHAAVARAVAEGQVDTALGVETAALEYGLDFVLLANEPYHLVVPSESWDMKPVQALVKWLRSPDGRHEIGGLGGYEVERGGEVTWLD